MFRSAQTYYEQVLLLYRFGNLDTLVSGHGATTSYITNGLNWNTKNINENVQPPINWNGSILI